MAGRPPEKKSKNPLPGIPVDDNLILKLIKPCNGNLTRIAESLGCDRHTIRNHIDKNPILLELLNDTRERRIDLLEDTVWQRATEGQDTALQTFLLRTQARARGYDLHDAKEVASDLAKEAFAFVINRTKNPADSK